MFSIIIPLYNKAPYIEKALRSIQTQTFREFEVIVIDDGSTDDSFELANKLIEEFSNSTDSSPPLGGFRGASQDNQGVSTARSNGVKLAKYPYICFLDADDWWASTFLEEMKVLIDEFPDAGIYGTNYYIVKNGNNRTAPVGVSEEFKSGKIDYCKVYAKTLCMPLWTGAVCIPKKIFDEEKGFKPNLKLGEDFDLWIRIALKYPVAFLNKPLAYYNQDVEQQGRGVVHDKIYAPDIHFIFNLDYLTEFEHKNEDLKLLLDKLRVYTLFRYRMQNAYKRDYKKEISKVNFSNLNISERMKYTLPISYYKFNFALRRFLKQILR